MRTWPLSDDAARSALLATRDCTKCFALLRSSCLRSTAIAVDCAANFVALGLHPRSPWACPRHRAPRTRSPIRLAERIRARAPNAIRAAAARVEPGAQLRDFFVVFILRDARVARPASTSCCAPAHHGRRDRRTPLFFFLSSPFTFCSRPSTFATPHLTLSASDAATEHAPEFDEGGSAAVEVGDLDRDAGRTSRAIEQATALVIASDCRPAAWSRER